MVELFWEGLRWEYFFSQQWEMDGDEIGGPKVAPLLSAHPGHQSQTVARAT